jgi:3-isopropylmalate/(R)-2-methylmalate dehydratase small subunit
LPASTSRITGVTGHALVLRGDDIDTDRIIPARFLKAITFDGLDAHVFEDDRREATARGAQHPFDDPARCDARLLLVNANFGCGSSREHAPQALRRRGFRAIVGESFGEIFLGNSTAIGLACVTASRDDVADIMARSIESPSLTFTLDLDRQQLSVGDRAYAVSQPATIRHALLTGEWDATGLLLDNYEEVERVEARLPYRF